MYRLGYTVILASRDTTKGTTARAQILEEVQHSQGSIEVLVLDMSRSVFASCDIFPLLSSRCCSGTLHASSPKILTLCSSFASVKSFATALQPHRLDALILNAGTNTFSLYLSVCLRARA